MIPRLGPPRRPSIRRWSYVSELGGVPVQRLTSPGQNLMRHAMCRYILGSVVSGHQQHFHVKTTGIIADRLEQLRTCPDGVWRVVAPTSALRWSTSADERPRHAGEG